jgi:hypothetical protein
VRTFLCSLRTDPAPLGRMGRSAGPVLRALRKLEGEGAFALCARDFGVRFQGSLRTDPAPLGVFGGSAGSVLRSQEGSGEEWLSRCARGNVVIAFNARCGPIPLRLAYFGAPQDRSSAR